MKPIVELTPARSGFRNLAEGKEAYAQMMKRLDELLGKPEASALRKRRK